MDDKTLILSLGGPSKLAKRLKLPGKHAAQRVSNWMTRGIPDSMKLRHPSILRVSHKRHSDKDAASQQVGESPKSTGGIPK